ncbi:MOP flippase family protein [Bacillus sp. ISL-51]|uniref:teichuronic acid biosynthesis protein TuaB n=1 Tax=Bacteria TaxID=2 RepID=UPI001BE76CE8|nr:MULTISPECIES: MOP flippase family protein [Bacteria]MBT2572885.1 MOP flippase family protein [Bacillus sp. ISL-51]MBT2635389.1 MOP flippase family protein [Bacillus sp. ISL-26]MBT2713358.1 MOP flippase family protein [Pseudomonas sp. ISL-88]
MPSITNQILSGAKWTSISTACITVIQVIQFALLGRVMSLSEFGLVGMITTVVVFAQIALDMGFGAALIQKDHVTERQLSSLYWMNIATGIVLFALLFFSSPFIADFYRREELTHLIRVLAIMFLIAPIGQQYQYMLQKALAFNALSKIEIFANMLSFVYLAVSVFYMDPILAYVISQVLLQSSKGLLYWASYRETWSPSLVFDLRGMKGFFSFGAFQLSSRLVNRLGANIDMILIGGFMGAEALGIYNLAYQIVTLPVLKINPIITRVAFPVFAKNKHENSVLREGFLNMTKMLALVSFPLLLGLVSVSDAFVASVFGEKWLAAVPVLNVLAIVGILRVLMNPNGSVLLAKGRADLAFYWDAGVMLLYGASLYAAVLSGNLLTVAWTYAFISILNFLIGRWLLAYVIKLQLSAYFKAVAKPFLLTAAMGIIAFAASFGTERISLDVKLRLAISVACGALFYLFLLGKAYPHMKSKLRKGRLL